ncbi:MAG: hypothetical protein A2Y33_14810 [Spirochaetes bacterium GWF1_51_8]|nr:MAG: hypothetical protein A2Y33_14810 [Spirochaetes bacterium GWF1_51_8]
MRFHGIFIACVFTFISCTAGELDSAIAAKDLTKVKMILSSNTGVDTSNIGLDSLLHLAILKGDVKTAKFFIAMGADVTVKEYINSNNFNISVLHTASVNDDLDMVKMLVENGAEIDAADGAGRTALFNACAIGNLDMVKYLVGHNAAITVRETVNGTYIIHEACYWDNIDVVKYLLYVGINKNLKDFKGNTPFKYAVKGENLDIVKLLVGSGVEIDAISPDEGSIFHGLEDLELVKYLVSLGLNPGLEDANGETPLQIAIEAGNDDVAEYLKGLPADTGK